MANQSARNADNPTWSSWTQDGCCLSEQTKVPSIAFGRFSVVTGGLETTPQATSIWNPGCVDLLRAPALQLTEAARLAMVDDNGGLDYANLLRGAFGDAADLETCAASPIHSRSLSNAWHGPILPIHS